MTTEELFKKYSNLYQFEEGSPEYLIDKEDFKQTLLEFAKFHVTKALETISDGCIDDIASWDGNPYTNEGSDSLDRDKIMKIYPLSNIE